MKRAARVLIAVIGAATIAGCGQGSAEQSGNATAPPQPDRAVAAADIGSLVVPVDRLPLGGEGMTTTETEDQPVAPHPPGPGVSEPGDPCHLPYVRAGSVELFGDDTLAFRNVRYSGSGNIHVIQAIGIYPDNAAAAGVLSRLADGLSNCRAATGSFPSATITPTVVFWATMATSSRGGSGDARTDICGDTARVERNVVIRVSTCQMDSAPQVAAQLADQIVANVKKID